MQDKTTEELLEELRKFGTRSAAEELGRRGESRAVEPLLEILRECAQREHVAGGVPDQTCLGAMQGLAWLKEPRAFDLLVKLLHEARGGVQSMAASCLSSQEASRAVPILREALAEASPDSWLRHEIVLSLARLRVPEAIDELIGEFTHPDQDNVPSAAARSLARFGTAAIPALDQALQHSDYRVRQGAVLAFGEMRAKWLLDAQKRRGDPQVSKAEVLRRLALALKDEHRTVRWQAARLLGDIRDKSIIAELEPLQNDADPQVRTMVARTLRKLGARSGPQLPKPGPNRWRFDVFADYHQFCVVAPELNGGLNTLAPGDLQRGLSVTPPYALVVITAQTRTVPVIVELGDQPPADDFESWDRVVEASLTLPTGQLEVYGLTDGRSADKPPLALPAGTYRVRIYSAGLSTHDEDWYRVLLWPDAEYREPEVLRATMT